MDKKCRLMKRILLFLGTVGVAFLTCAALALSIFADAGKNEIASITLNKAKTDITFEIRLTKDFVKQNKSEELYIFEFQPYESTASVNEMNPVKSFKAKSEASVKLSFIDGNENRLYSKFAIAEKLDDGTYSLITSAVYIDNIESTAKNTEPYPEKNSIKGLTISSFSDAQQLGASHTVINLPVNEYILGESSDSALSFHYNGQTYYLNKNKIAVLDHKVKTYTEAGITVYFNVILTAPDNTASDTVLNLYYDGISQSAALYALNTKNEDGMKAFRAFMDYMCARYTDPAHSHGFVPAVILGFEVNSNTVWNNAGNADISSYVYSYCTAFRTAYTAMRSNYSEGKVYISLGNNFNHTDSDSDLTAKSFLDAFAAAVKNSGDIEWGVSINPYSSSDEISEFWNDTKAKSDFETPYITMKNISTFTEYMSRDELLFNGETRSIIVGEWGVSGDPSDERSMDLQAAAYALAYYTAAQNEHIDAFIYKRHVDYTAENAYYGLWTCKPGTLSEPNAKKPLYNVFSLIDTDKGSESASFVRETVGSGVWGAIMGDDVKYAEYTARTVFEGVEAAENEHKKGTKDRVLFDLKRGSLCSFYPSDGAEFIELRAIDDSTPSMLHARVSGIPTENKGISNSVITDTAFEKAKFITLRVMVAAPEGVNTANLSLRLANNTAEAISDSQAAVPTNEWRDVTFNIKDFSKFISGDVDFMKIWISVDDPQPIEGEYGLWLDTVTVHVGKGLPIIVRILLFLVSLLFLAVAAYGVLFIRAQLIRKKRREEFLRRRQAMMRQNQVMNDPRNQNNRGRQ